jgi:hypothetical protein
MGCVGQELAAINNARGVEHVAPIISVPSALAALSPAEQLFVLTNLERIGRGLAPVAAMTDELNRVAAEGAAQGADPELDGWALADGKVATMWASNWAGDMDPIGSDYLWMYDDGVGFNVDCPNASAIGCWGHRNNVLVALPSPSTCGPNQGSPELIMGAAVLPDGYHGTPSVAEITVGTCGSPTGLSFTWSMAVRALFL